jgi:hypothetical protein
MAEGGSRNNRTSPIDAASRLQHGSLNDASAKNRQHCAKLVRTSRESGVVGERQHTKIFGEQDVIVELTRRADGHR